MSSLTEFTVTLLYDVRTLGNVNRLTLKFAFEVQLVTPAGQGFVSSRRVCTPLNAHCSSVRLLQLESVVAIEPVVSTTIATFHGWATPCMDAVAIAFTVSVLTPKRLMKVVFNVAD